MLLLRQCSGDPCVPDSGETVCSRLRRERGNLVQRFQGYAKMANVGGKLVVLWEEKGNREKEGDLVCGDWSGEEE
jgi:hypothetical protein